MTLHPLSKLALALALFAGALVLSAVANGVVLVALVIVAMLSEVLLGFIKGLATFSAPFALSLLLIGAADPSAAGEWWSIGPLGFGPDQASWTVTLLLRVMILIGAVQLFVLTTRVDDLHTALVQDRVPKTLAYAFTAAAGFVPHLRGRIADVRDAQVSRGVRFRRGSPRAFSLIGPLLLSALEEAADREITLLVRGFGLPGRPTALNPVWWKHTDTAIAVVALAAIVLSILWKPLGL